MGIDLQAAIESLPPADQPMPTIEAQFIRWNEPGNGVTFLPGCLSHIVANPPKNLPVLLDHKWIRHLAVALEIDSIREDEVGATATFRPQDTPAGRLAVSALRMGRFTGASFGYFADCDSQGRISRIDELEEITLTERPANKRSRAKFVTSTKNLGVADFRAAETLYLCLRLPKISESPEGFAKLRQIAMKV